MRGWFLTRKKVSFVAETIDTTMVKRKCILSLQSGVGSLDDIYSLIMGDDVDNDAGDDKSDGSTSFQEKPLNLELFGQCSLHTVVYEAVFLIMRLSENKH